MRWIFTACCLVGGLLWTTSPNTVFAVKPSRIRTISVNEIKPGMKGYGLTVFKGTKPERFGVTVIDILHNFRPDQALILIRAEHPVIENAKTIAGMSGSPIFLDGRLAGAYAYGWMFGRDPVAGVTPIKNMLSDMKRPMRANKKHLSRSGSAQSAGIVRSPLDRLAEFAPSRPDEQTGLVPALTPIMVGGLDVHTQRVLQEKLRPLGFLTLQAGGGGGSYDKAPKGSGGFVNGGAIGVELMRGDINMTAVGTITLVSGNKLIAFGHPMFNAGQLDLPTATARVVHVLASQSRSFKIAESIRTVGSLVQDRQASIVVDIGRKAPTIPINITLKGAVGAPKTKWSMRAADHRLLTPTLVFSALSGALNSTSSDREHVQFEVTSRVKFKGQKPIQVQDIGYSPLGPSSPFALGKLRVFSILDIAYHNPFEQVKVEWVNIEASLTYGQRACEITEMQLDADEVDPGSDTNVRVTIRPYGGKDFTKTIKLHIPWESAGKTITLKAQPGNSVKLERVFSRNLGDMLANTQQVLPANELVLSHNASTKGLIFEGHIVSSLPGSAMEALKQKSSSFSPKSFETMHHVRVKLPHVLVGAASLKIKVRNTPRYQ